MICVTFYPLACNHNSKRQPIHLILFYNTLHTLSFSNELCHHKSYVERYINDIEIEITMLLSSECL